MIIFIIIVFIYIVFITLIIYFIVKAPKDCTSCRLFEVCEKNFKKTGITICDTHIQPQKYYYEEKLL